MSHKNYNESISTVQVGHQTSLSNWARRELQKSVSQHSHSKLQVTFLVPATAQHLGVPEAKFPRGIHAKPTRPDTHVKAAKGLQLTYNSTSIRCREARVQGCVELPYLSGELLRYSLIEFRLEIFLLKTHLLVSLQL